MKFVPCFTDDEGSQPRKRAKSIARQKIFVEDSCPDLIVEHDFKIQELLEVQKSHLKVDHELIVEREALNKFRVLSKEA